MAEAVAAAVAARDVPPQPLHLLQQQFAAHQTTILLRPQSRLRMHSGSNTRMARLLTGATALSPRRRAALMCTAMPATEEGAIEKDAKVIFGSEGCWHG